MKTLYIIRHAKSSWSFRQLDDFSRPLGERGRRDVLRMGKYLGANVKKPDVLITSTASRAFYTSLFLADAWSIPEEEIVLEPGLYHADGEEALEIIRDYPNANCVAIAGHNPGFTGLTNELSDQHIANIPTCGVVGISFDSDSWDDLGKGNLLFFHYPKGI
ncbi:MAG: histidine phosphatase family protein [Cyclobacteriaceae bacterium]|nr:histidine phosphatase family protein [Cyclobacteriaceae bacterium HetDA_MAG_MS6]